MPMAAEEKALFEEKQYLGYNKYSNIRRMVLGIFCFLAFYWSDENQRSADLLFLMGISIMVFSGLLTFILHLHTKVVDGSLILDGLWTAKRVKIDLNSIESARAVPSRTFMISSPVYNLHWKGNIRFYTRGREGVELIDKDGLRYVIGSQMSGQLVQIIREEISRMNNHSTTSSN
jgi:hypothetical protein